MKKNIEDIRINNKIYKDDNLETKNSYSKIQQKPIKKLKSNIKKNFIYISLFFLIFISEKCLSNEYSIKKVNLNLLSEITLEIKNTGPQNILNKKYKNYIEQVKINGNVQSTKTNQYNLVSSPSTIIITINNDLTDISEAFEGLSSIINIDLSKFDTSKIANMAKMFKDCTSLVSLNLDNLDTSLVTNMEMMFQNCYRFRKIKCK